MKKLDILCTAIIVVAISCTSSPEIRTFEDDLEILQQVPNIEVLKDGNSMVAVSGTLQGRVFTSTTNGLTGRSLGYFNREKVSEGTPSRNQTPLGGESRMWFGPEIGKYAIFFAPGTEQNANTIDVSPALDTAIFRLIEKTDKSITYGDTMFIRNANAYTFRLFAKRKTSIKTTCDTETELGIELNDNLRSVAFSSETWIENVGDEQWTKENGLLSIWEVGCMLPSESSMVIIPTKNNIDSVTNYFTSNDGMVKIVDEVVFYKANARYMNKLGIQPKHCIDVLGSYVPEKNLLTIAKYNLTNDSVYVNSVWGHKEPYKGDVINIFNGEVNPAEDRNWPFFEIETSSSAKELKPSEQMYHFQTIYHFEGNEEYLSIIAKQVLGVDLKTISNIFH